MFILLYKFFLINSFKFILIIIMVINNIYAFNANIIKNIFLLCNIQ